MKLFPKLCMFLIGGLLLTAAATRARADEWNKKTYVTLGQSIEVPGAVLPPGKYVFKLLDSAMNRNIVQILNDRENHVYTTDLTIPKQRMEPADKTIITFYEMPGGAPEPIRAWFYPGDTIGQEFTYPRDRAQQIALAMSQNVPMMAEANPPATPEPAPAESSAAPEAAPPPVTTPAPSSAEPPAPVPSETPSTSTDVGPSPPADDQAAMEPEAQEPQPTAAPTATPPASTPAEPAMPKTAGDTATIALFSLGFLGAAASLRLARRSGSRS